MYVYVWIQKLYGKGEGVCGLFLGFLVYVYEFNEFEFLKGGV